ncbi:MAG: site-specific integrase [Polaromonas sp.]|nr:site-specific integrase [Polaromonas sp.]
MKDVTPFSQEETGALLKFAIEYMQTESPRKVNDRTRQHYQKTAELYFDCPEEALRTTSKATYYARKAALIFVAADRMLAAIKNSDLFSALKSARVLRRFFTYSNGPTALAAGSVCPIPAKAKVGKRKSLRGLPDDWRAQLVAAAPFSCREWILLLAVGGVRPEEIAMGVQVQPTDGGVHLTIRGAKTDRGHGQPERVVAVDGPLALLLAEGGARTISATSANSVSVAAGRLGRKVFGERRSNLVSAYSFRHQFASDLKASGLDGLSISAILGHSVDDTKKHYGTSKQARGLQTTRLVSATRTVKVFKKSAFSPTQPPSGRPSPLR